MSNTRISYLYRDGCNNKEDHAVVVAGTLTYEQLQPYLDEEGDFNPVQVGLPHPGHKFSTGDFPNGDDHPFCELDPEDVEATMDPPAASMTAAELLAAFQRAHAAGWSTSVEGV
jgi:hypothetical protein